MQTIAGTTKSLGVITFLLILLFAISPAFSAANSARVFVINPAKSQMRYSFDYSLHDIKGVSHEIAGKLLLHPDGKVQMMLRSAVISFKSGDSNRDVHMLEVIEGATYPYVVFKAVAQLKPEQIQINKPFTMALKGELDFHGQKHLETIPIKIQKLAITEDTKKNVLTIRAKGAWSISLEKYKIERPSLMFVKLDDRCNIDFDLQLEEQSP
ncbi:MAG: YceI family protein [Deltaproteobacteria bacterium]|nr:YceI family protein [Deltaproteobacteria bacterium]